MFDVNIFNELEPLKIYLTRPDQTILYCLNAFIDKDSAKLSPAFNQTYNLTFNIYRYMNDRKGNRIEFFGYDYIVDGMYLSVGKFGNFRINNPESVRTPDNEYKSVTAISCDCELVQKNFKYQINTGTETSLEYLVEYEDGEQEKLVDPYTGIPYDWILLYNTIPEQLSNFKSKLDSGYFGTFSNSKILVTDSDKISEIIYILDLVKRLKRTITYDESGDVSSSTDNFEYTYNENNDVAQITIYDTVNSRLSDVITYYNKYYKQLSLLHFISNLTDGNWTIGEVYGVSDGDYTYANRKIQFEEDGTIYSFLTQSLARAIECFPILDIINRTIGIKPISCIGENTGGIISFNKLINSLNISCDENNLITKLYVYGENELSIEQVNFGREYIEDLTYMVNALDSDGNRIYVSDYLAEKYLKYKEYQETNRVDYIELTKEYNQYLKDIDELKYRVPNDSLYTNWGSFSIDELETELTTYKNLLASLISLYKEDYGTVGCNKDGSINEDYIKKTEYWYDYYAYVNTIKQIEVAINTYPNYNNESKWTETQQAQYEGIKDDYLTEWSLYGSVELKVKIDSYASRLEILVSSSSVIKKEDSEYEIKTWDELTDSEKEDYLTEQSYKDSYDMYMEYYNNMTEAQAYLDSILAEISDLEEKQNICKTQLDEIKKQVSWEVYFTSDERKILNKLLYEGEYNNNNILTTSINDVVDSVDIQKELLLDGQEKISILSRPQLIFNTELSNLFGLVEFKPLWDDFKILNYILVQYRDNKFAKLRLTGFSFNPLIPSIQTISVSFSNMVSSKTKFDDTASILGLSSTEGLSTYGSNSSSGGNGSYEFDTISNTMLEKLLNSETFGTRVTNVILDTMSANLIQTKKAIIGSSAGDNTEIDGKRITTGWIMSGGYNGNKDTGSINNTKGSIINLENDCFNLGGGSIIYDGTVLRFGEDVSIAWSNVTGTDNVATKDDIPSDEYITQITKNTVTTSYVNALEITAKEVSADWVYTGELEANQIKTGKLTSKDGKSTVLDLDNNTFNLGTSLSYANNKLTLGDDVTISWGNVTGTDDVATKDDVNNAIIEAGGITEDQVTEITRNEIKSAKISANQIYGNTLTLGGSGNANGILVINDANGNAIVTGNKDGLVINKGTISWSNVTGTDDVATTDDIPTEEQITQITKNTVTTTYVNALKVTAKSVETDAIKSKNYSYSSGNYSNEGTFLDLSNGALTSKNFAISSTGEAYFNGEINATSGKLKSVYIQDSILLETPYGKGALFKADKYDIYLRATVDPDGVFTSGMKFNCTAFFDKYVDFNGDCTFYAQHILKCGSYVHSATGESGSKGYVKIAEIDIVDVYCNVPIIMHIIQRDRAETVLSIWFNNENSTDPTLKSFTYYGGQAAYLVKSSASTWGLYVQKSEAYDNICVSQYYISPHDREKMDVTWKNVHASSLPSGYTTSTAYIANDSKWITISSFLNSFAQASTSWTSTCMYRKIGNHVYLKGCVKTPSSWANSASYMFQLPVGYRPNTRKYVLNPMTLARIARIYVDTNGYVSLEWTKNLSDGSNVSGELSWVQIDMDFLID